MQWKCLAASLMAAVCSRTAHSENLQEVSDLALWAWSKVQDVQDSLRGTNHQVGKGLLSPHKSGSHSGPSDEGSAYYKQFEALGAKPLSPGESGKCWFHSQQPHQQDQFVFKKLGGSVGNCAKSHLTAPVHVHSEAMLCDCKAPSSTDAFNQHFVELGGNDGQYLSNLLFFEAQMGWTGIVIEASPSLFSRLLAGRPRSKTVQSVIGPDTDKHVTFYTFAPPEISPGSWVVGMSCMEGYSWCKTAEEAQRHAESEGVKLGKAQVPTKRLSDLIAEEGYKKLGWISVDVEGAEDEVFSTIDFGSIDSDIISYEGSHPRTHDLLLKNGYVQHADGPTIDTWFQKEAEAPLASLASEQSVGRHRRHMQDAAIMGRGAGYVLRALPESNDGRVTQAPWGKRVDIPSDRTHVQINLGPNKSPIGGDDGAFVILVEPLPSAVQHLMEQVAGKNVAVYQSAISDFSGKAEFHEYNGAGVSSSLSKPKHDADWNQGKLNGGTVTVPVHTLEELLQSIPEKLPITYLKTDMQGYDLRGIKSAKGHIRRVEQILSEVYADGFPTYDGVENELHDFLSYMQSIGFEKTSCADGYTEAGKFHEMDCTFQRQAGTGASK